MSETLEQKNERLAEIKKLYYIVKEYATERGLENTLCFLPKVQELLLDKQNEIYPVKEHADIHYNQGLKVCKMLVDLEMPLNNREMDLIIAGSFGHLVRQIVCFPNEGRELKTEYGLDDEVIEIVDVLTTGSFSCEDLECAYYEKLKQNKLALFIKLVEMAITAEQHYRISPRDIDDYLRVTREYFFPLCIYAKETYNELELVVSLMMEKVKLLADVTEILSRRYRDRRRALVDEMLVLQEENARLRVSIKELEEERANREK